jgi:hypothetical protein
MMARLPGTNSLVYDEGDVLREVNQEMKKIIVRTTFGAFLIAAFALGQTGPAGWKGTIATENGVKVVRNPVEPLYGTFAFDLEEDLVLGGNPTKEDYYFPKGGNVSVDDSGRIYVADVGNRRVQLYDHEGKFLRTIGRQGQGPGEYQYPSLVLFDGEGNIYIRGARELVVFAPDGGFKKKVTLRTFLNRLTIGSGGAVVGTTQPGPRDAWKQQIVLVDSEGTSGRARRKPKRIRPPLV